MGTYTTYRTTTTSAIQNKADLEIGIMDSTEDNQNDFNNLKQTLYDNQTTSVKSKAEEAEFEVPSTVVNLSDLDHSYLRPDEYHIFCTL